MKNRHITDTILDINAFLTISDPPPQSFLISLDWSKAYDRVSHNWLDFILQQTQFPLSFQRLTHTLYHNRLTQIYINGSLGFAFRVGQGVPQGDPFAPLLFNLSLEPFFNALRSIPTIIPKAYADDSYIVGQSPSDWDMIKHIIHQHHLTTGGIVNWDKTTVIPLSPMHYNPPPDTPPPSNSPLKTLGIILPLNSTNIDTLWQELIQKVRNRASSIRTRNLSLRGRVLAAKALLLSKVWYHTTVAPPPPNLRIQLNNILKDVIWHNKSSHPATATTASLPLSEGGINYPNIEVEVQIRAAHLMSHAFHQHPPFWMKVMNHMTIKEI